MDKKVLSIKEAAEVLHLSKSTIRKYIKSGKIPATKVNKRWRIEEKALGSFVLKRTSKILKKRLTELSKAISPFYADELISQVNLNKIIINIDSITSTLKEENNQLQKPVKQLSKYYTELGKQLQSVIVDMQEQIKQFQGTLLEYEKNIVELAFRWGWVIADPKILFSQNYMFKTMLIKVLETGNREEVDNIFTEKFSPKNLKKFVNRWYRLDCFKKRKRIIDQAIDAYTRGQYYLSIYALTPQVEGIVWDNLSPDKKALKDIESSPNEKLRSLTEEMMSKIETTFFNVAIHDIFGTITEEKYFPLYKWANFNNYEDTGELNRHTILHGISVNFAFKANSMKLIFFLDFLYQALTYIKSVDKKDLNT